MPEEAKAEFPEGKPTTDEELFYLEWGRESLKNGIALANSVLKQLLTTNTAILTIVLVFADRQVMSSDMKKPVVIAFLVALIISLFGFLPYEKKVILKSPSAIKAHKKKALRHKRIFLWLSATCMLVGFIMALFGIVN
ncbi:hypothetical protein POV27_06675 [Aureisphaera galaxeae]|uniref:hypothetical protein n=1 Tax=Aureisphaera galaxeae TaxID=1538023 RepID=UPI0023502F87|nr:hypothetical protein [Aureisphaera galaxeae]MDC8003728.1 hypothetical protein [Aureisphaera galaxeae]